LECVPVYHIKGWGKFNRHYGNFYTGADSKFADGSATREYDIVELLEDGSTIWRACVVGITETKIRLEQLAKETGRRFVAVQLYDRSQGVRNPLKVTSENEKKTS